MPETIKRTDDVKPREAAKSQHSGSNLTLISTLTGNWILKLRQNFDVSKSTIIILTIGINLKELPDCHPDPKTKKWWNQHPQAWSVIHKNQKPPEQAMRDFELWLRGLNVRPIFMAWPATFDFPFVEYYAQRFLGKSLFGHSGICARSFAMAHLKEKSWLSQNISMRYFYKKWPPTEKSLKHDPLNDAIRQGELFCRVLIANQNGK